MDYKGYRLKKSYTKMGSIRIEIHKDGVKVAQAQSYAKAKEKADALHEAECVDILMGNKDFKLE